MSSYFDEHSIEEEERTNNRNVIRAHDLLLNQLRTNMIDNDFLSEQANGMFGMVEPDELAPPASKLEIEKVLNSSVDFVKEDDQCPVCLMNFDSDLKDVVKIKCDCKQPFHRPCIKKWLMTTNSCPNCRFELPTDNEDYENMKKIKKEEEERRIRQEERFNSMYT